jgi:hypothetical protein
VAGIILKRIPRFVSQDVQILCKSFPTHMWVVLVFLLRCCHIRVAYVAEGKRHFLDASSILKYLTIIKRKTNLGGPIIISLALYMMF